MTSSWAVIQMPASRSGAACNSGIVPSAAGPTLSSRFPPLATTSVSSATISRPVMWCSARSARLWQKLYPMPRQSSHGRSTMPSGVSYSCTATSGAFEPPPIVDDDLGVEIAGGVDQSLAAPVVRSVTPVAVTPQELRAVTFDEVEHVGVQHIVDVVHSRVAAVAPVQQRVVRAEHETGPFARRGVLGEHVAPRPVAQHGALGVGGVPPAQAVVMLGDEDGVTHARRERETWPRHRDRIVRTTAAARSRRIARRGPSARGDGRAPRPSASGGAGRLERGPRGGCDTSRRTARPATMPAPVARLAWTNMP